MSTDGKAEADGCGLGDTVPDDYRWETILFHMARVASEAQARSTTQRIADRTGGSQRKYRLLNFRT